MERTGCISLDVQPNEATNELRHIVPIEEAIALVRGRMEKINRSLEHNVVNKHDLRHITEVMTVADKILQVLQYNNKQRGIIALASIFHDIGYAHYEQSHQIENNVDYLNGSKGCYREHAKSGANEAGRLAMYIIRRNDSDEPLAWYVDEQGGKNSYSTNNTTLFSQAIFYHNAFGKGEEEYNPDIVPTAALALQFADKTDIGNWRVFPAHITPEMVANDENFHHRIVPFCTMNKEYKIDFNNCVIAVTYTVDPQRISEYLDQQHGYALQYSFKQYIEDFGRAYGENFKMLRDVARVILYERFHDNPDKKYLNVHLVCPRTGENQLLSF